MKLATKLKLTALFYQNYFKKNPLVLNIELSHACNLKCIHCGRIRDDVTGRLKLEEVLAAIDEVDPPIVYFTGGEPFLFVDDLAQSVNYALQKKKIVTVVTNGTLFDRTLERFDIPEEKREHLILMFSIDGMKTRNDRIRGEGVFEKVQEGIKLAEEHGFQHRWMNFTIFSSNIDDVEEVISTFRGSITSFHFNMYYDFLGDAPAIKQNIKELSEKLQALKKRYQNIHNLYLYFQMWEKRDIDCTPWATVTRDASGWRSPCYFIDGPHLQSYQELMKKTDWKHYIKRQAPECANCMAHCGFEPTIYGKKKLFAKEIWLQLKARL